MSETAGYSGKPLAAKLGIKPASQAAVFDAPEHYPALLGRPPDGAALTLAVWPDAALASAADLIQVFVRDRAGLEARAQDLARFPKPGAMIWISWPKKSSPLYRGLTEDGVREIMLPTGWVDVKVAAVDADWSGLKFLRRR